MLKHWASALFCLALLACGHDDAPSADYANCGEPARIAIDDWDIATPCTMDGGDAGVVACDPPVPPTLAIPKDLDSEIPLQVRDAEGDLCDPSKVELDFDDNSQIEIVSRGDMTVLRHRFDYFDVGGAEPLTAMHATLGGISADWPIFGTVNLEGTWSVTVYQPEMYPDGLLLGDFVFTQRGRHLKWYDCTVGEACDEAGTVLNDQLTLMTVDANFALIGTIDPDRNHVSGIWSTSYYEGTWTAERAPK